MSTISTNKTSQDEIHNLAAAGVAVYSGALAGVFSPNVLEVQIVNPGTTTIHVRFDAVAAGATDHIVLPGERLYFNRNITTVSADGACQIIFAI